MIDVQLKTENLDETTRALLELPGIFARARASGLKSVGYEVQQDLKRAGREITPKLNPHTGVMSVTHDTAKRFGRSVSWGRRRKPKMWGERGWIGHTSRSKGKDGGVKQKLSTRLNPFARFVNMVRYSVDTEDNLVEIGILKPKPIYYVWFRKNTEGFSTPVTPRMRKFFFAIGFPLKKETTSLEAPSRPWINKVREKWDREATPHFEKQFWAAYRRYDEGGKKA